MNELEYLKPKSNESYIGKIRKRLNEDESARNEREKRRRKVLVEQQRAHEAQEVRYYLLSCCYNETVIVGFINNIKIPSFIEWCIFKSKSFST